MSQPGMPPSAPNQPAVNQAPMNQAPMPGPGYPQPGFAPGHPMGPPPGMPPSGPGPAQYGPPTDWQAPAPTSKPTMLAGLLQVLALVLVPLGAALPFGENFSSSAMWSTATTWAAFATTAAIVQLAPLLGRAVGWQPRTSWTVGAVAVGALIGFWVLIVLPGISSGQNFVLTMGVFAAAIGLWLSPGRRL